MQRKILNVYVYRDTSVKDQMCYKMRLIEIQSMENFPEDLNNTMMDLYDGMEAPFAACLSNELDKYKENPGLPLIGKVENKNGGLFKKLCDSYTREVIHSDKSYIYQDVDMLLHASDAFDRDHRGDEQDMFCILGALDNAVAAFRNNAVKDKYEVNVNLSFQAPDFSDHLNIIKNAFEGSNDEAVSLSLLTAKWLVYDVRTRLEDLPRLRYSHALDTMAFLYKGLSNPVNGETFSDSILKGWYISSKYKANPATFFAGDIKSAINPMWDNDLLTDTKTMRI